MIHRDLKPANIKVRPDGTVKLLDFGLAKYSETAGGGSAAGSALTYSPTMVSPAATAAGMLLGTAAYMAPEQARGRPVDKRADVWAFGCVLYEMLAGRPAFSGDDVTEVLAAVLKSEPDWTAVPAAARPLIRRCLQKDPRSRLRDIGDAMPLLEAAAEASSEPKVRSSRVSDTRRPTATSRSRPTDGEPSLSYPTSFNSSISPAVCRRALSRG